MFRGTDKIPESTQAPSSPHNASTLTTFRPRDATSRNSTNRARNTTLDRATVTTHMLTENETASTQTQQQPKNRRQSVKIGGGQLVNAERIDARQTYLDAMTGAVKARFEVDFDEKEDEIDEDLLRWLEECPNSQRALLMGHKLCLCQLYGDCPYLANLTYPTSKMSDPEMRTIKRYYPKIDTEYPIYYSCVVRLRAAAELPAVEELPGTVMG